MAKAKKAEKGGVDCRLLERSTQLSICQASKGARWMPWHMEPMKDVASCEKPRGAASRH